MGFRTKLDYSDNRQIKQREKTSTTLSGATVFGLPFSGLTSGVDPNDSGTTESVNTVVSTFSGNGTTTNFTWYDPRMDIANSSISAITSSNSATTQTTGNIFVVSSTGVTADGYDINLQYTGTSFDLSVGAIFSGAGPVYSGTVTHDEVDFLSAGTLDYKGRTIWIDNPEITRTKRLIVTNNPSVGYVLTCDSVEGEATWSPVSAATSGATFWEEDGTGNTALKDEKGGHTINGVSDFSIIAGGETNNIDSTIASGIFAGSGNTISADGVSGYEPAGSAIIGGKDNIISSTTGSTGLFTAGAWSVIAGGSNNAISGHSNSFIGGGTNNSINFSLGNNFIIGGIGNTNKSAHAGILASDDSTVLSNSDGSVIVGGNSNVIDAPTATILGGTSNKTKGEDSSIIGGTGNVITGTTPIKSVIIGGENSDISASTRSVIVGGSGNGISNSTRSSIIGGSQNIVNNNSNSSILNGFSNTGLTITDSLISGRDNYMVSSDFSSIIGGEGNIIGITGPGFNLNATSSSILGGLSNTIYEANISSSIIGGSGNTINKGVDYSAIIGGKGNQINLNINNSVILGGEGITATTNDTVYTPDLNVIGDILVENTDGQLVSDINDSSGPIVRLSGNGTSQLVRYGIQDGSAGMSIGQRGFSEATFPAYGKQGDGFLYSGIDQNGLNLISSQGTGTDDYIRFYAGQVATATSDLHIQGSGATRGYIGIGTESPTEELDINGELRIRTVGAGPGTTDLGIDANGVVVDQASDVNLKENIKTIENALDKVLNLRGVTYNWKDRERGGDDLRIGFIAQEVNEVEPILAYEGKSGFMGVHYKDFPALIVEAIKELANGNTPLTKKEELIFETQTIASEDNNIELNYGGTHESALDGGITVVKGVDENNDSMFMVDSSGDWTSNTHLKPKGLVLPEYTPTSSDDESGKLGEVRWDDDYLYIKTNNGWRRSSLERF